MCLGNICRSPTAEAVFRSVVEREDRGGDFLVDSCGTGGGSAGPRERLESSENLVGSVVFVALTSCGTVQISSIASASRNTWHRPPLCLKVP